MNGEIYYEKLAHALWRLSYPMICCLQGGDPGALEVRFQSESRGLRTWEPMMVSVPPARGQEKTLSAPQADRQADRKQAVVNPSCLCLFLFRPSADWKMPTHMGECSLLY